ncbi:MAG: D-alanine--D-alanine ligase [Candidatus Dadabacteria bacterium]|nr:MAG: D-alanine--D-alanine ligase [Candidatus Dadabacteria bacterium]
MSTSRQRVLVIMGGRSAEHSISLRSAASVVPALREAGYFVETVAIGRDGVWRWGDHGPLLERARTELVEAGADAGVAVCLWSDRGKALLREDSAKARPVAPGCDVVFPLVHGPGGEDGSLQGLLEILGLRFVGAGCAASAAAMDKLLMKVLCSGAAIPQADFLPAETASPERLAEQVARTFGFPCFVKPARLGSSVGISRVSCAAELGPALDRARGFDERVLIERAVEGREIEIALLGSQTPEVSPPGEIVTPSGFYDFEAKYVTTGAQLLAPAELEPHVLGRVQQLAVQVWKLIGCRGMARADFFVERDSNRVLFNEINTIPGFTEISMYPRLWACAGIPLPRLVDRLVQIA